MHLGDIAFTWSFLTRYHRQFLEVLTNGTSLATGYLTSRTFLLTGEAVACCLVIVCFCECTCMCMIVQIGLVWASSFLNQVPHISNHFTTELSALWYYFDSQFSNEGTDMLILLNRDKRIWSYGLIYG